MKAKVVLTMLALFVFASPIFAQGMEGRHEVAKWVAITSGFSMAIASGLCGLAQAKAVAAAAEGMARNPGASAAIRFALLLGLVLIESLALYTLVIIFAKVVVV
jgi:F-type H+-transporting ATPase subunit c